MTISANEVKTRGVSIFGEMLEKFDELTINVRGKNKYVVMDIERYRELRALELDSLYEKAMDDIKDGRYTTDIDEHLRELRAAIR
ncbi:MAG: prevent-host-death protein [Sulfurovum sp. AS07-7]|nr:MAG: prevent-host-death protein [Sulfurovum sp. AS07-7]